MTAAEASRRFQEAFDLFDEMVALKLEQLKRQRPRASDAALQKEVSTWLGEEEPLDPRYFRRVSWPDRKPLSNAPSVKRSLRSKRSVQNTRSSAVSRSPSVPNRG